MPYNNIKNVLSVLLNKTLSSKFLPSFVFPCSIYIILYIHKNSATSIQIFENSTYMHIYIYMQKMLCMGACTNIVF